MPVASKKSATAHLTLLFGQEFLVQQRARELVHSSAPTGTADFGLEIIEATASNATEAVTLLSRLMESLSTPSLFGGEKVIWLKDCNFLGTDRLATTQTVLDAMDGLTTLLQRGLPIGTSLIISAPSVDERRTFYKTCQKLGEIIYFQPPNAQNREEETQTIEFVEAKMRTAGKTLKDEPRERLLELVGSDLRQLDSELDKLITYVGARKTIVSTDIAAVTSSTRSSVIWDLTDAFGERDLARALTVLEDLFYRGENRMGILFALINKTRSMLLFRDLLDRKMIQPPKFYQRDTIAQLATRIGSDLPSDRAFNPLRQHPYAVFKGLQHAASYSRAELITAQAIWLDANQKMVSSGLDERLPLQKALVKILSRPVSPTKSEPIIS